MPRSTRSPLSQTPRRRASTRKAAANPRRDAESQNLARQQELAGQVEQYRPLVQRIASAIQRRLPRHVLRDDLVAAGMSGLWDALRRKDEHPADSFEWYLRVRVRGAILDELRAQDWLPRRVRAAASVPTDGKSVAPFVVRMDDISEWEQHRCLATDERSNSEHQVTHKLEAERLAKAVRGLPDRERLIVSMHYYRGVRFKELGSELGVSEPRVSQLHSRAMRRLRSLLETAA